MHHPTVAGRYFRASAHPDRPLSALLDNLHEIRDRLDVYKFVGRAAEHRDGFAGALRSLVGLGCHWTAIIHHAGSVDSNASTIPSSLRAVTRNPRPSRSTD